MTVLNPHLPAVSIIGVGHHLPAQFEDNETLCRHLDVTPEWIIEKTGIERRYIAAVDDTAWGFSVAAARQALAMAGIAADQLGLIVCCTFSGDYQFPPLSVKVAQQLVASNAQTFDLQANCSGFVAGLTSASDRMRVDTSVGYALVIGVEMCSRYIDRKDANTAIYLSDGAGAAVLGPAKPGEGVQSSAFHTDPSNYEAVRLRGGGASFANNGRPFDATVDLMEMNGIATWKQAITHLPPTIRRACAKAEVEVKTLDFMIFHQANLRLIEYLVRKMGLGLDKTYTNVAQIGNSGSASLAIALSEAVRGGHIKNGDLVALAGVGAGFNFAASVWRWTLGVPQ
ncbi:ketoacyl-ACP synthase III [Paucibacter sp. TC2R-5]|nr:ketoacyl-ACP synthase III [Paucibacter sp. TC2R-5]